MCVCSFVVVVGFVELHKQYGVYFEARSHWIKQDSNPGPLGLESNALPSELPCFGVNLSCLHLNFFYRIQKGLVGSSYVVYNLEIIM